MNSELRQLRQELMLEQAAVKRRVSRAPSTVGPVDVDTELAHLIGVLARLFTTAADGAE